VILLYYAQLKSTKYLVVIIYIIFSKEVTFQKYHDQILVYLKTLRCLEAFSMDN